MVKKGKNLLYVFSLLLVVLAFSSCKKEEQPKDKMYRLNWNVSASTDAGTYTVFLHEYNSISEAIKQNTCNVSSGASSLYIADPNAVKVKVYLQDFGKWVQQVFYLSEDNVTEITITDNTIIGPDQP